VSVPPPALDEMRIVRVFPSKETGALAANIIPLCASSTTQEIMIARTVRIDLFIIASFWRT
jgi:hypothetical protein